MRVFPLDRNVFLRIKRIYEYRQHTTKAAYRRTQRHAARHYRRCAPFRPRRGGARSYGQRKDPCLSVAHRLASRPQGGRGASRGDCAGTRTRHAVERCVQTHGQRTALGMPLRRTPNNGRASHHHAHPATDCVLHPGTTERPYRQAQLLGGQREVARHRRV